MHHIKRGRPATGQLYPNETLEDRLLKRQKWLDKYYKLSPIEQWVRASLNNSKRRAKRLGVKHTLTSEQIRSLIPEDMLCPILGVPLDIESYKRAITPLSATVDRIDPDGHYTFDNTHVICNLANRGKCHLNLLQLTKLGQWAQNVLDK